MTNAQTVFTGTTAGGPTFNRPLANGNAAPTNLSGVGTAVRYATFTFTAPTSDNYTFQSVASYDNYTVLYQNAFNPGTPLANVLIANDDNPSIGLSGFSKALTAGTQYVFVTTGFANTDFGTYTNTITPGLTAAVPEPGAVALFAGLSLSGLGFVRKRRRK